MKRVVGSVRRSDIDFSNSFHKSAQSRSKEPTSGGQKAEFQEGSVQDHFSQGQGRAGGEVESAARNYIDVGQPQDVALLTKVEEILGYQQKGNDELRSDEIGADV